MKSIKIHSNTKYIYPKIENGLLFEKQLTATYSVSEDTEFKIGYLNGHRTII